MMKYTILLALLALVAYTVGSPSPVKSPSTSADLTKKGVYESGYHKKKDGKKVEVEKEEEEEEEEEAAEDDGSDYEDEYYGKTPDFYGGIKVGVDPWKGKEEEGGKHFAKKEPKLPHFGFGYDKEKKHKVGAKEGEFDYPAPKFFYPAIYKEIPYKKEEVPYKKEEVPYKKGEMPKEIPFWKSQIPKDIYKKEEKGHKAPIKPVYDEKKFTDIPFYGIPMFYGDGHKVHDIDESEEEKIDPKLLYKEYMLRHIPLTGTKIPLYTFDPAFIHELMSQEKKFKSKNLEHHSSEPIEAELKKKAHALTKEPKEATSIYKADIDAVKKSIKS